MMNFLLIIFVGIIFGFGFWMRNSVEKKASEDIASHYEKVDSLMNKSEYMLFKELQKQLGEKYNVFTKVRMEDFVHVKRDVNGSQKYGLRGRIRPRHVDFLICDKNTHPLIAIELDGSSHKSAKAIKNDNFKNAVYDSIELPLVRIRVGESFEQKVQEMAKQLETLNPGSLSVQG